MHRRKRSGNPPARRFELIAPGRTLTVIVPSRKAELNHPDAAIASSQYDRTLIQRFAEEHYLDVDWVEVERWDGLVPALAAGEGDLVAADITVTESRKERVAFTVPAIALASTSWCAMVDRIESIGDLAGREIAIREQSSFWQVVQRARRAHPGIEVRLVPENTPPERLLAGVADGRFDMAAVDVGDGERLEDDWPALRVVSRPFKSDAWRGRSVRTRRLCSKRSIGFSRSSRSHAW